ncbi:VOC family protein [Nocardioides ginsengisoli]|uniref:VOC family protein n=1 Tax=Nocardioides ginsengisoli TaxID=363868 RepID=A0ABW3W1P1_9ACTN
MRIHHVQVACPRGGEDAARRFYGTGLGMTEVPKPPALAARGGCWFRAYDEDGEGGGVAAAEIHVGVEEPFTPARKAHPALVLGSVAALDEAGARLAELGFDVDWTERQTFAGYQRCHAFDGAGNRVELLAEESAQSE